MNREVVGGRAIIGDGGFQQTAVPVGVAAQAVLCKLVGLAGGDQAQMRIGLEQSVPEPDVTGRVVGGNGVPYLPGAV